jgi:hypothetical protein
MKHRLKYPRMDVKDVVPDLERELMGLDMGPHMAVDRSVETDLIPVDRAKRLNTYFRVHSMSIKPKERLSWSPEQQKHIKYGDPRRTHVSTGFA